MPPRAAKLSRRRAYAGADEIGNDGGLQNRNGRATKCMAWPDMRDKSGVVTAAIT
jgi:hypothetical protein